MNEECGCCEGVDILTPAPTANRPGLSALSYRVGTHATFRSTLQARLSGLDAGPLADLKSRHSSDLAIALLDAWATVADVLTFYQERIANEGYLRTATERRSVLELARLVGYTPRPGVAASVYLAYTLETGHEVTIPAGSKAQTVPGPGEQMQTFETREDLEARAPWNRLTPRLTRLPLITLDEDPETDAANIRKLYFVGLTTNLRPGDALLVVFRTAPNQSGIGRQVLRWIETVELEPPRNCTVITLQARALRQRSGPTPIVRRAEEVILRHREVRAFNVAPRAPAAGRVVEYLERLEQWLTPQMTDAEVAARIVAVLPALHDERRTVRPGTNQPAWLDSLIAALTELRRSALPPGTDGAASAVLAVTSALQQLSRTLQQSPTAAVPPASPRQLRRSSAELLAPESDVIPQLLTALHPELATTLYPAWANARVTDDPDWESVQALRVKAAPFGHNAPLRPVYGEGEQKNVIIGHEEWPLTGSEMIRLQVLVGGEGSRPAPSSRSRLKLKCGPGRRV